MGVLKSYSHSTNNEEVAPDPSPERWTLIMCLEFDNAHVLVVKYDDCTNFEGLKIMVYRGNYIYRLYLDPHFADDEASPIARFKPTLEGLADAVSYAKSIKEIK